MANKRKVTTAVVAGVTAVALLLGGTFAWTSISQTAKNEAIVDINPGGRLHDDFDGKNKDVYVENFSSGATGVNIFARIRLDQYFEVGQDAGKNLDDSARKAEAKLGGSINDVNTWETYIPTVDENGNIDFSQLQANDNWQWKLGNDDTNKPYYMPTFNMNKDSLAADINGTYEGTVDGDIVHYDDFVKYGTAEEAAADPNIVNTVEGTEVYDWDDENAEEEENPTVTTDDTTPRDDFNVYHKENQTHTAQQIDYAANIYTMQQWIDAGSPVGPYWVYDTDGWAYWAQPIKPGETTGLLLDSITMSRVPDDNWYYGINVVGQFATASDIYQFDGMSPAAEVLFGKITNTEEIVISGADVILPGNTATYSATRMALGSALDNQPTFTWTATDADGTAIDGVTMTEGTLTVGADVALGTHITVTATVTDGTATAAEGDEAATQTLAGSKIVTVAGTATVTSDNSLTMYTVGGMTTETFTATVDGGMEGSFTWSVTDGNGNKPTDATITADAEDATKATLTVGENETADKLIVTATFKPTDSTDVYVGTYEVKNSNITTTDEMTAQAYALVVPNDDGEDTYDILFVRSADTVDAGKNTYEGKAIAEVLKCDENSDPLTYNLTNRTKITNATFANKIAPASTAYLFNQFTALKTVNFNDKLDASNLTNMRQMFYNCTALESIDLSGLKFSDSAELNVVRMFDACSSLTVAKLPEGITVNKLDSLFFDCKKLNTITGLNTWNVSTVEDFSGVFYHCESLSELDLTKWNTSAATTMEWMFRGTKSLVTIDLSNFDLNGVTNTHQMFYNSTTLTTITGADKWDVSTVTDIGEMFSSCKALELDCSGWNVSVEYISSFNNNAPGVTLPTAWQTTTE